VTETKGTKDTTTKNKRSRRSKRSSAKKSKTAEMTTDQAKGTVEADKASDQRVASFPGSVPSEQFPDRRAHTVDIADMKNPDKKYEGEHDPPINLESWVTLDGSHKLVPDGLDGRLAAVIAAPILHVVNEETGEEYDTVPPKAAITVKERSQGTVLYLPREAFKEIHPNGRVGALGFA
jgi:hypothetical protein